MVDYADADDVITEARYLQQITFTCQRHYRFSPNTVSMTTTCGPNGDWTPLPATCIRKY